MGGKKRQIAHQWLTTVTKKTTNIYIITIKLEQTRLSVTIHNHVGTVWRKNYH